MFTRPRATRATGQEGQIIVLFALGLIAIVAMVGLVLDGGDTFAQRRSEQNGADLAAIAGANAFMNSSGTVAAKTAAASAAATLAASNNGYTGANGSTINVTVTLLSAGANVKVDVTKAHANNFARVVGFNSWDVSVTATAIAGVVDTAVGAAPWTMNIGAFNPDGTPIYDAAHPQAFGDSNGDYPVDATDIAWTNYQEGVNVNASDVKGIVDGGGVVTATIDFDHYIGQHNDGNMTTVYGHIQDHLAGKDVPVPIVGPGSPNCAAPLQGHQNGCFKGWAMFHVTSASGGSDKTITGYFLDDFNASPLTVGECTPAEQAAGTCGVITTTSPFPAYLVRLTQ